MSEKADKHLETIYSDIREWLKFAEAKNALLLSFNGVLAFGIARLVQVEYLKGLLPNIFIGIQILSTILLLWSFLPFFRANKSIGYKSPIYKTNLRYYKDIYKLNPKAYLESIYTLYCEGMEPKMNKAELDLALQIIILSIISVRKNRIFNTSLYLTIFSMFILLVNIIIM